MTEHALKEPQRPVISREQFLTAIKPKSESFAIDGFGDVVLQPISLKDREEIRSGSVNHVGRVDEAAWVALTILKGVVEPKLTREDVAHLQQGSFGLLKKLSERIWIISGIELDSPGDKAKNA